MKRFLILLPLLTLPACTSAKSPDVAHCLPLEKAEPVVRLLLANVGKPLTDETKAALADLAAVEGRSVVLCLVDELEKSKPELAADLRKFLNAE